VLGEQPAAQCQAARGVERAAQSEPALARLLDRFGTGLGVLRCCAGGLGLGGLPDGIVEPPGQPLGLLGGRAGLLVAACQREGDGAGRDRLDRLGDQAGPLADVEGAGELGLGAGEVAAVA